MGFNPSEFFSEGVDYNPNEPGVQDSGAESDSDGGSSSDDSGSSSSSSGGAPDAAPDPGGSFDDSSSTDNSGSNDSDEDSDSSGLNARQRAGLGGGSGSGGGSSESDSSTDSATTQQTSGDVALDDGVTNVDDTGDVPVNNDTGPGSVDDGGSGGPAVSSGGGDAVTDTDQTSGGSDSGSSGGGGGGSGSAGAGIGGDERDEAGGNPVDPSGPQGPAQDNNTDDQEQGPPEGPTPDDIADGAGGNQATRGGDVPDSETDVPEPTQIEEDGFGGRTAALEAVGSQARKFTAEVGGEEITGTKREIAKALEDQVAGKQVTDLVGGLRTTGADLRERDLVVEETSGGGLTVNLSEVGRKRVDAIENRQSVESIEQQLEEQLDERFTDEDVTIASDGSVDVSQNVRDEALEQDLASQTDGITERDIEVDDGAVVDQRDQQTGSASQSGGQQSVDERAAAEIEDRLNLEQGEDFVVQRTAPATAVPTSEGQGDVEVALTDEGAQQLRAEQLQEDGDTLTGLVTATEGVTGVDLPGSTSVAGEAIDERAQSESGELFGGTSPAEEAAERVGSEFDEGPAALTGELVGDLAGLAEEGAEASIGREYDGLDEQVNDTGETLGQIGDLVQSGAAVTLGGNISAADADIGDDPTQDTGFERRSEEAGQALANLVNPGQRTTMVIEGGEFAAGAVESRPTTVELAGDVGEPLGQRESVQDTSEFVDTTGEAGALRATTAARAAKEQPGTIAAQAIGSAVGGVGLIRAGRAVGGVRGARAAGAIVDPLESARKAAAKALRDSDSSASGTRARFGTGRGEPVDSGGLLDIDFPSIRGSRSGSSDSSTSSSGASGTTQSDSSGDGDSSRTDLNLADLLSDDSARLDLAGPPKSSSEGSSGSDSGSTSDSSSGDADTDTVTITRGDLDDTARVSDPTRGGRFGSRPTGGRSPDNSVDRTRDGDTGAENVDGFRDAQTEMDRGGERANELREQAEASEVLDVDDVLPGVDDIGELVVIGGAAGAGAADALARQDQAQQSQLLDDEALDVNQGLGQASEVGGRVIADVDVESLLRSRTDQALESRLDITTNIDSILNTGQNSDVATVSETALDTRSQVSTRTRTRTRTRTSTRTRTDTDRGDSERVEAMVEEPGEVDVEQFTKIIRRQVASPEEVLDSQSAGGGGESMDTEFDVGKDIDIADPDLDLDI